MFNVIRKNGLVDNLKSWEVFEEKKVGIKRLRYTSRCVSHKTQNKLKKSSKRLKMYTTKIIVSLKKWKKQSILTNKFLLPFLFHGILAWECWEKKKLSSTFLQKLNMLRNSLVLATLLYFIPASCAGGVPQGAGQGRRWVRVHQENLRSGCRTSGLHAQVLLAIEQGTKREQNNVVFSFLIFLSVVEKHTIQSVGPVLTRKQVALCASRQVYSKV